jgi:hypothetical protein
MDRRRLYFILGGVAALVCIGLYFRARLSPETLLQVATEVHGCIERGDSACLERRMEIGEKKATGASVQNLDRFLNQVVRPGLTGFEAEAKMDVEPDPVSGELMAIRHYRHPDGRKVAIALSVAMTEDGIRAINVLPTLIFARFESERAGKEKSKRSEAEEWVDSLDRVMPEIRTTGIEKIGPVGSRREFFTWAGWREHLTALAARTHSEKS